MGYNKKILIAALEEIKKNGQENLRRYEAKKMALSADNPRLIEIENEIMKLGPMLGISAISGDKERTDALKRKNRELATLRDEIYNSSGLGAYVPLCAECMDSGYMGAKLCSCVLKRAKELSYAALSESMPIDKSGFENFELDYYEDADKAIMKKIFDFCKNYAAGISLSSESLMFFGGTGLGKTHLSLAIAGAATEKGMGVVYSPTQNILQKLENEHFSYSDETPILDDVMSCDLLILDDLGAEFSTSFTQALIYNIINTRLLTEKPTIISTNLTFDELEARYTPRVASRIAGCYNIKKFVGEDIRQKKRLQEVRRKKTNE